MSPTIIPGDHLVTEQLSYRFRKPKRGEVIVFSTKDINYPYVKRDTYYVKRIVGLPGETIQIHPPNLIVNGSIVKEPIIFAQLASLSLGFSGGCLLSSRNDKVILGGNEYLTLGDNSQNSLDGRYFGPISGDSIVGRVSRIYWPFSRIKENISQPEDGLYGENADR